MADGDVNPHYPAGYTFSNLIAVAAIDSSNKLASFSNYGKKSVHVAAPGVKIKSTVPKLTETGELYQEMSGTSMATPHVAGIAALLLSQYPGLKPQEVRDLMIRSSTPSQALKDKCVANGYVNTEALFQSAALR